jgi:hypothetical protein
VRRRILVESRGPGVLRQMGGRRLLLLGHAMAHRSTSRCSRRMSRVWSVLLTGVCGHGALRCVLQKRILSRGVMRRRLKWSHTPILEVHRARR